jgi:hypothetical protein
MQFYYFLFPLIFVFRLARTTYILTFNFVKNDFYLEILKDFFLRSTYELWTWYFWWLAVMGIAIWTCISNVFLPIRMVILWFLLIYDEDKKDPQHASRGLKFPFNPGGLEYYDERLLVFSTYRVCRTWAYLLTLPTDSVLFFFRSKNYLVTKSWLAPRKYMDDRIGSWPPDGWPLHLTMLVFSVMTYAYIVSRGYSYLVCLKAQKLYRQVSNVSNLDANQNPRFYPIDTSRYAALYHSAVLANYDKTEHEKLISFDSDSLTVILDNSANTSVFNKKEHFVDKKIHKLVPSEEGVITIGGSNHHPEGYGDVSISLKDDDGNLCELRLSNVLYFPDSPVNIVSITCLAASLGDPEGTWVQTRWRYSVFQWDHGKHKKTVLHPSSNLPEVAVNIGYEKFAFFTNFLISLAPNLFPSVFFNNSRDTSMPLQMDEAPILLDQRGNIRNHALCDDPAEISTKDIPTTSSSKDLKHPKSFAIGDSLRYCKDDYVTHGNLLSIDIDVDTDVPYYNLKLKDGQKVRTTREHIQQSTADDVMDFPISQDDFVEQAKELSLKDLEAIMKPSSLSPLESEFMHWHARLNHLSYAQMFRLAETNQLPSKFLSLKGKTGHLKCASCLFGKQKCRPWRTKSKTVSTIQSSSDTEPGSTICIDQVISKHPGLLPRMSGRHTRDRLTAITVFFDIVTKLSYSHLQRTTDGEETLAAKQAFERYAKDHEVNVRHYRADNGRFAEQLFRDEIANCGQKITFCGVNAHHQNGVIERHIQTLTTGSRTLLLHAKRFWPEYIGPLLWPYAWKAYEQIYNELTINSNGLSPLQEFSSSEYRTSLKHRHTWGCPVYIMKNPGSQPKWDPRSRVGIYLGHSPCHAGSVALVLNPTTLHVSPQFHVVFDDEFTTVQHLRDGTIPTHWKELIEKSSESSTDEDFDLAAVWSSHHFQINPDELENLDPKSNDNQQATPESEVPPGLPLQDSEGDSPTSEGDLQSNKEDHSTPSGPDPSLLMPTLPDLDALTYRRSERIRKLKEKAKNSTGSTVRNLVGAFYSAYSIISDTNRFVSSFSPATMMERAVYHMHASNTLFDGTLNSLHHAVYNTVVKNDFTFKEMLQQDDRADFIKAMQKEIEDHQNRNHWSLTKRTSLPKTAKTILAIWSFRRKTAPDGRIVKHKARICCHGGMQQWGVNYWETYAPVVNWFSIRTLLALSIIHKLESRSIDFTLAFPQADLDIDVFMELPIGFEVPGGKSKEYVLKLNKNLYGLKQAAFNWFEHLKNGLQRRGFQQSEVDPCLFHNGSTIILVYVDDCIIFDKSQSVITKFIDSMRTGSENYVLTDEGDIKHYLGVELIKSDNGFELHQPFLIDRILSVLNITEEHNSKPTPAIKPLLHRDLDGVDRKYTWNYRQAVGMLGYLQGSSRPDISMAVHQCARFNNNPKAIHERAIRHIGKYLLGTKNHGILYQPDPTKGIEVYVDADFAGGWSKADAENAENVMSRTGYIIFYAGCPLIWCSKLQTEIALSTAEAEYIALSQAMRETIPVMQLLEELSKVIDLHMPEPNIFCKVFEDNTSCISIATAQKFSPRTKHISLKYHHFRKFVTDKTIRIFPIATKEQTADIFTKPLDRSLFLYLRKKLNGW